MKRAFFGLAGFLSLCLPAFAQLPVPGSLLDQPSINSPWASLESQDRFMFSTGFGSLRATEQFLPSFDPSMPLTTGYISPADNKSSVDKLVELHTPSQIRYGGEIGFLYGKSTGSGFGREDFAGYVIGTVGNDKFSITAGYYRQETNFSGSRFRR